MEATARRKLLATYVDFLFASVVGFLIATAIGKQDWLEGFGGYIIAGVLTVLMKLINSLSLGNKFLSIDEDGTVDSNIFSRESFFTMLLATILVLDGTKQLVRWLQFSPWPFMGFIPEENLAAAISIVLGLVSILVAYLIFKLEKLGLWLAIAYVLFYAGNILANWSLTNEALATRTVERRALQGLPVRPGEIEFMQAIVNPFSLAIAAIILFVLFWYRTRFGDNTPHLQR